MDVQWEELVCPSRCESLETFGLCVFSVASGLGDHQEASHYIFFDTMMVGVVTQSSGGYNEILTNPTDFSYFFFRSKRVVRHVCPTPYHTF